VGTDIHFYVQRKDPETREWIFLDPPESILSDWDKKWEEDNKDKDWYRRSWYSGRNYDCFAILADVRNGYGFAGTDTGNGFKPIAMPRGLPDDFIPNEDILEHDNPEYCHSHQWLSLREVLEYPVKELETQKRGWVGEVEFERWLESGDNGPRAYCGGVCGPSIEHVDVATMTKIVKGQLEKDPGKKYYCQLEWGETYFEAARYFFGTLVPGVKEMVGDEGVDDVRFVMWFGG
jgi:hypothetical protein